MKRLVRKWVESQASAVIAPTRRVAIMVPLPTPDLSADDEVSMRHLRKHLDHYDKFLLVPKGMGVRMDGFQVMELDHKHFGSAANHNRMLYRTDFWEKFADYEYVLSRSVEILRGPLLAPHRIAEQAAQVVALRGSRMAQEAGGSGPESTALENGAHRGERTRQ